MVRALWFFPVTAACSNVALGNILLYQAALPWVKFISRGKSVPKYNFGTSESTTINSPSLYNRYLSRAPYADHLFLWLEEAEQKGKLRLTTHEHYVVGYICKMVALRNENSLGAIDAKRLQRVVRDAIRDLVQNQDMSLEGHKWTLINEIIAVIRAR